MAIYVYNMWFKFHKNRFTGFEDIVETVRKNVVLTKTRLNFFLMKNHEKILAQGNLRCLNLTKYLLSTFENSKKKKDYSMLINWTDPLN